MVEDGAKIGAGTDVLGRQRANAGPAGCRVGKFTTPLMKFGEPDQCHQVALVGLECRFESAAFRPVVAAEPMRLRQIQPQRCDLRVSARGCLEMAARGLDVVPGQCLHAENVVGDRMLAVEAQCRLGFSHDLGGASLLLGLSGSGEMLLNGHRHPREMAADCSRGQPMLAGRRRFPHKPGMAANAPALPELIDDGRWLAHRYDEAGDSIHFRFVPREAQRTMTFLTDHEIGDAPLAVHSRADCFAEAKQHPWPTPRLIFHSAYCCSTLLARTFDLPGASFGLKEPQILNDVIGLQLRRVDPRQVAAAMDVALLLLARPLGPGEVNVVKPSNLINPLLPLFTAMRTDLRGLFLHAPLEAFLGSIARKDIEGRAWVRELMWKLIQLGQSERFGFTTEELYRQTDLQAGAIGWLAQQALFAETAERHAGFRTLDSETLIERPAECLAALGTLFDLTLDADAAAEGPAFRTHSKDRSSYSPEQRQQDRERGEALHAREIGIVLTWAERMAEHAQIRMHLPAPLLGAGK